MPSALKAKPISPVQSNLIPLTILVFSAFPSLAVAQEVQRPLQYGILSPVGGRPYLVDNWSVLGLRLTNSSDRDREARMLTFYGEAPDRQYGRDLWIPARAARSIWYEIGPPSRVPQGTVIELKSLLYDRTGGSEDLLRSREGPPVRSDLARFESRAPGTTLMLDMDAELWEHAHKRTSIEDEDKAQEVRDLIRVFRSSNGVAGRVNLLRQRFLPPIPEALAGIEHFVLASERIAADPAGARALRAWVERGGSLWVMLDQVKVESLACLLGDALDLEVVDRMSLTTIDLRNSATNSFPETPRVREFEQPVEFVRVLAPRLNPLYTIGGWPVALLGQLGKGRVLFTTLGPRAWMRPRTAQDGPSPYTQFPALPVAEAPLHALFSELQQPRERPALAPADLRVQVGEQVSYPVVGRGNIGLLFGAFFVVFGATGAILARRQALEHAAWLGPLLAFLVTGIFLAIGFRSRGEVPPTVVEAQIIDAVTGLDEVQTSGLLGIYQPTPEPFPVGAEQGGQFQLVFADVENKVERRLRTDLSHWHWENLELTPVLHTAPFHRTAHTAAPVEARARFGPKGFEARMVGGAFRQIEDMLVSTPGRHTLPVRLEADGFISAAGADDLRGGTLVEGSLLSDRERMHKSLYEKLLAEPVPRSIANRTMLWGWTEPLETHFQLTPHPRLTGTALLAVPVQFEPSLPSLGITIPAAFVAWQHQSQEGRPRELRPEFGVGKNMRFRFSVPASAWPFQVEHIELFARVFAPERSVSIQMLVGQKKVPLQSFTSPAGLIQVPVSERSLLQPDERGNLYVSIDVGNKEAGQRELDEWRIESVGMEIQGRTPARTE